MPVGVVWFRQWTMMVVLQMAVGSLEKEVYCRHIVVLQIAVGSLVREAYYHHIVALMAVNNWVEEAYCYH
jgi:deoxyribodipyrimidine photolyase-like uncharacterized protein